MKSFTSITYKILITFMVAILALTAVTPVNALSTAATPPNSNSNSSFNATPQNAYVSDNAYAVANTGGQSVRYFTTLGYGVPVNATITGIVVSLEGNRTGTKTVTVDLTWNNNNFSTVITAPNFAAADSIVTVGSAASTAPWGAHAWTPAEINAQNFRVRVTANGGGGTGNINLDQVLVTVSYTLPTTTSTVTSSLNPSNPGDAVTFSATVTGTGTPTGTVTFLDNGTPIGNSALAGGTASITTSTLTGGPHNITATYSGDTDNTSSTSLVALVQGVNQAPAIISANNTTFTVGTLGNFPVTASGFPAPTFTLTGALPAGVNFNGNTGVLSGTPTLGTNAVGTYPLVITATNGIGTDATQNFTLNVIKRNQTIAVTGIPGTATYGATFTINPTATSGLPVTVGVSGGCTILGNQVTINAVQNCIITADQAGDNDYNAVSPTFSRTVTVNKSTPTVTVDPAPHTADAPSQSFYSYPMTFTVTVTSPNGTPTGSVTLTGGTPAQNITVPLVGGVAQITTKNLIVLYSASSGVYLAHGGNALACFLAGVACPGLVVTYSGDANFNTDTENVSHIVYPAPTQVNVTSDINPSAVNQPVIFTVTVSTTPPGTGIPPGTVTLWDGATQIGGPVTLDLLTGIASFPSISTLAYGAHNITARYTSTSSNYASNSTSNTYVQNVRRATTTTLTSNNNPSVYGSNVTFTATVNGGAFGTPAGTVEFYDGAILLGTGTLNAGGVATFTTNLLAVTPPLHPITAKYLPSVSSVFATSTSAVLNQAVDKAILMVRADNQSIVYGDADPSPFTFTYTGFLLGDTAALIDTPPTCDVLVAHVNVGAYPITCSGGVDDRYTFNYAPPPGPALGTLTVTQKPLTITADSPTKVYFTTFTFLGTEFSETGLLVGDTISSVTLTASGTPPATDPLAPVGSYTITPSAATGTGLGNYNITYINGTMNVVASNTNVLTITANDQTKIYGNTFTFTGNEFTATGLLGGDTIASVTFTTSGTPSGASAAAVVNSYTITPSAASGTGLNNYVIVYTPGQMVVTRRDLTFIPANQTKIYGDVFTTYSGAFNPINGVQNGDNITPAYTSAGVAATATVAGSPYPITVTLNDPDGMLGNYNVPAILPTATLTVTPRPLTVTANNQSKPYGTAFTFLGTEFTTGVGQLTNGDTVSTVTLTSTGTPATALASPPTYPIVPSLAIGTGLGNYAITYVNGVMTVTKPDLIVTWDNQTKTYGDVFPVASFTYSITGLQNGDVITATFASAGTAATATVAGSPYSINITYVDLGGKLANYNRVETAGTLTVQRRDVGIVANDLSKVYGDPITLTGVETGNFLDGITFAYSSPGTALTAPVGSYAIAITLTDPNTKLGNYNYTLTPAILTVTPRPITVTSDPQSKQYGTWFFAFTGGITGLANGDNITPNFASAGSLPSAAVGTYPITVTPLNDPNGKLGNYAVTLNEGLLTVGSSTLTITANNQTITYGDADPAFTFTYSGFTPGDTPAVLTTLPTCTVAGPHTAFGTYPIVCSGGVDDAYSFNYIPATLTITRRDLSITSVDKVKTYGALFTAFTGSVTGAQFGETITATYDSLGAPVTAGVGSYPITITLNPPAATLTNYNVIPSIGTLTVNPRDLTVTPADKTKVYGDVFPVANFTGSVNGIQNGDPITVAYASAGAASTATVAGSLYDITATLNAPAGVLANYTVVTNIGHLDVTRRPLTVTPDNKGKVFGTVFNVIDYSSSVNSIQNGDPITLVYDSPGAPAAAAAGSYVITVTLNATPAVLANYTVTLNTGTMVVGTNVLTVTANNQTIVYGNPDPNFTFAYAGFQGGDTAAVLTTAPTCQVLPAHNAVGTFPISCSGGVDDNYIFSYVPATLTVTPRALTVVTDNQTKVYGAAFNAYTGNVTGIQAADGITVSYASAGSAVTAAVGNYAIVPALNDPNNRLVNNYTVTITNGTLAVTQRPLVATPDNKNKVYGALFTAFTGTINGIQNGDAITPIYDSTGAPAVAPSGIYDITVTLNATPAVLANYAITLNTGILTVGGNFLIVTPADKTKIYGDNFSTFTGTIVGLQPGDIITANYASTGAGVNAGIGNYNITATLVDPGGKLGNYTVILNTGTLSVTPRALVVTPDNKAKAFGAAFNAFTGSVAGIQNGDAITPVYASAGAPAAAASGSYPITVTLNATPAVLANYTVTLNTGILMVGANVLTVTANNQTIAYGNPDPTFTFTYTGFQGGDTAAVLTTVPVCQVLPAHNAVGTFPISCAGGVDDNYIFSYVPATLTVTSRALTVTPANQTKVYGDTFTAFTGVLTGLQASDNITATYASTGAVGTATVGNYPITVATLNDPNNRLGNYTITRNTGTLTVSQRALTVTSADKIKFYGSLFNAFTGTITGIQNGDNITATYASAGAPITAIVGNYPITITVNDPGGRLPNYTVVNNPGTLSVAPRDLLVLPADKTKPFGTTFTAFTGSVIGIRNGDNITATYDSTGRPAAAPVGNYDIVPALVDPTGKLNNYDVTANTGTLTVAISANIITIMIPAPITAGFSNSFTVAATASSGLPVVYSAGGTACTNAGAVFTMTANSGVCIVQYDQPGDANFPAAAQLTQTVNTQKASQTITVTTSAPVTALNGTSFPVAATSSSGLPVSIISNGNCSGNGANTTTINMATGTGICTVIYAQAGDSSYLAAASITEIVSATNVPVIILNPVNTSILPGATATFTSAATGNPSPTVQWQVSADGGATFTDIPGATATTLTIIGQLADNGLQYHAVFTNTEGSATSTAAVLHVDNIPPLVTKINSVSDTGDGRLDEMEKSTVAITQLLVNFNEDVSNPVGNIGNEDVTNPANYVLVRDNGDGIQTIACSAGIIGGDIAVTVDLVSYNNKAGSGPYIANLYLNGGTALPNGTYRLLVCGTTSITDVAGNKLAGDGTTAGTDFARNFIVDVAGSGGGGGGGGGGGNNNNNSGPVTSGLLIPITGFKHGEVTILPKQPADKAYASTDMWLEIPKLGIKMSIVGVPQTKSGWDISWLGSSAGWLNGSAFPTWKGNSVITAHVWDALNRPGPFVGLINLQYGDQVKVHAFGNVYTYEVAGSSLILPSNTSAAFKHEEKSWLTLITCEDYKETTQSYTSRRMVRAVLMSVTKEK